MTRCLPPNKAGVVYAVKLPTNTRMLPIKSPGTHKGRTIFEKTARRAYVFLKKIYPRLNLKNPSVFHRYCFTGKSLSQLLLRVGFVNITVTNSPLTKGDPYYYVGKEEFVKGAKTTIDFLSKLLFLVSLGRLIVGPSLLVWAKKP